MSSPVASTTALAGGSQKTFCAEQRLTSSLKTPKNKETDQRRKQINRLVATNNDISDVDWLHSLNEEIAWIEDDPIQEISKYLKQSKQAGKTINELHVIAHGNDGEIKLGNTFLTKQYLEESAHLFQEGKLEAIYLWSCEAGRNTELIKTLGTITGADVYASTREINRKQSNLSSIRGEEASLEVLIGLKKLQRWEGTLFAAPFLGKAASSYQELSIDKDNVLSPPSGVTITAQTLIDDGSGNISLSTASSSHISTHEWPHGFGVTGSLGGGDTTEISYHNASGLSEKLTIEFDEIVPEIGFATAWLALVENDGVYKMYREGTLVKTGAVDGVTDRVDPPVNLSSDDGYGFDKIEFTADGWESDYLIHKITFDAPKADNAGTASVDELDDASNQDIASQTGSLSVSDSDNAGTITASIVGDPIITLNGSSYTLPASANALTAGGAMSISPTSQTWGGSWTPITWTYNPASADLDFVPAGQDLVIGYDIRLSDGTDNSNTVRVEITVVGENDVPSISDATYTLDEDTAAGTIFHDTDEDSTGNDTDIESETVTYSITAGNPDGIFAIDANTGEISIAAGQSLDHATANQHILTVEASDSAESGTADITVNVNNIRPTIAISSDVTSLKAGETAAISFTLSEAATDFIASDITVTGGSLSDFSGSGTSYSATFTPTADSTTNGVIHVANDKFSDGSGDNNQDEDDANNTVTFTVDTGRPTIAITDDDADNTLSAGESSTLTFTLSEASTDFVEADATVTGGALSNWTAVSSTVYTSTFTPTANSTTKGVIHVANDKFSDAAGNNNQDEDDANNTVTLTVDTGRPTIAISSDVSSLKAGETAAITFTLSEAATDFIASDITVTGGSLSNFSGSGTSYSATFTPTADSTTNGVIHVANDKFSCADANNNQDELEANNTVTLTVDTGNNTDVDRESKPDLDPTINPPSGFIEFIEPDQIKVDQPSATFTSDSLINYRGLQPREIVINYDSLLGEGGGGQTLRSKIDGGISQEKGVLILANSFCSPVDDSIIQHEVSSGDAFFVVLTAAPTSNLTVTLNLPKTFQGVLSQEKLVFTPENWDTPQKVSFTAASLGRLSSGKNFKITATSSKEGGYLGTEQDSAIFNINNAETPIQQASTRVNHFDKTLDKNHTNLDVERLATYDELSPLFTILRIISFPAVAIILAVKSVKSFQSKSTSSSHSTSQRDGNHASHTLPIELIAISSFHGIPDQSDFHHAGINQNFSNDSSFMLLAQMGQPQDCCF